MKIKGVCVKRVCLRTIDPYRTRGRTNRNAHVITISWRNFIVSFATLRHHVLLDHPDHYYADY